ncbi:MAG: hypothetical protein K9G62_05345 [Alphaproteobacteria bacterium]|nr:hypothetical protein [Alphaproteobacteria bacterium]
MSSSKLKKQNQLFAAIAEFSNEANSGAVPTTALFNGEAALGRLEKADFNQSRAQQHNFQTHQGFRQN